MSMMVDADADDERVVRNGLALAKRKTRLGSRSFYLASYVLEGPRRAAAYALYAFLRAADDAADDAGDPETRLARIARQRAGLERVYRKAPAGELEAALSWAVAKFGIPKRPLDDLLNTVMGDVGRVRFDDWAQLDAYCYGVASTVGLAMAPILSAPDRALDQAAALGRAMQLTNILRDVREDLAADRVYLPRKALSDVGITEADLRAGVRDERFRAVAGTLAARAWEDYHRAEGGIAAIPTARGRTTVRVMRAVYSEILREIQRREYDVFSGRVVIGAWRKAWILSRVVAGADPARGRT